MNRFRLSALALGAAATMLGVAGQPAQAMAASTTGTEHFIIVIDGSGPGPVQAFGLFNAQGSDIERQSSSSTGTSTFVFSNGKVKVQHTDNPGGTQTFNKKTCEGRITASGNFATTGGTGAYAGISGHGTYGVIGTLITAHTASGCGKTPIGEILIVRATGTISLP